MLINNSDNNAISEVQNVLLNNSLDSIFNAIQPFVVNITAAERQKFTRVNEKNKSLIDKIREYSANSPVMQSPEVDWIKFEKDYLNRMRIEGYLQKLKAIEIELTNAKMLHDYQNYSDSLLDYEYAKYKSKTANGAIFADKINELKGFFPNTGKMKNLKIAINNDTNL